MLPRGRAYRYPPGRNMPEVPMSGVPGGMLPVSYDMGGIPFRDATMQTGALASALANAAPDQQRTVSSCVTCILFVFTMALLKFWSFTKWTNILTTGIFLSFVNYIVAGRTSIPSCRSVRA